MVETLAQLCERLKMFCAASLLDAQHFWKEHRQTTIAQAGWAKWPPPVLKFLEKEPDERGDGCADIYRTTNTK